MLREIPFKLLLEWEAYDKLEPIGGLRGDWQSAAICRMLMDIAAAKTGSRKRFRTQDFLLEFGEERPVVEVRQTWQEQKMIGQMYAAAFNTPDKPKGRRKK
jgi:hypothetical protein